MEGLAAELAGIDLGDRRLNRRAQRLVETLGAQPTLSIPAAGSGWDETRAADRLFDHDAVTAEAVLAPHIACTEARLRAHPRVLCIQDTTELDYTKKKDVIGGLGVLNLESRWGLYLHATLVVTPERVPLGLLDAHRFTREPGSLGQPKDRRRRLEDKESARWVDGFARVNALAERQGVRGDEQVVGADRRARALECLPDLAVAPICGFVERQDVRGRQHGLKLVGQSLGALLGCAETQLGGNDDAGADLTLAALGDAVADGPGGSTHEIGDDVGVEQIRRLLHDGEPRAQRAVSVAAPARC
jgi:hypothetical protein